MTKVFLQPGLRGLSGGMGDWVYQMRNGKTILGMKPINNKEPSEAQLAQRERFRLAAAYAKFAMADEATRAFYEPIAQQRDIPFYALAIGDFLQGPSIKPLDLSGYKGRIGDPIYITTKDNIGVVDVNVELTRTDGSNIERGKAVETGARSGKWVYTATVPISLGTDIFIEAEGFDRPGSRTVSSANPIVGTDE